ncbi:MAG: tetratricopeptide repeat protein [Blastocatellia bacterium]|nr:tetratricopeptide repeat protein [Blastocatellia bacterium]
MSYSSHSASRIVKILAIGFLLLLANSSYLAAFEYPTVTYILNLTLHFGLGAVLAVLFLGYVVRNWSTFPAGTRISYSLLLISGALGGVILIFGATRPFLTPIRPLHWAAKAHVIAGVLGVASLALTALRLRTRQTAFARAFSVALAFAILFPLAAWQYNRYTRAGRDHFANPKTPPLSMEEEGGGPKSPFWPSSANTNVNGVIPANFFMTSETCARCHKEIYDEWNSSAHHMSSFNNQWYRKSIEYMQDVVGTQPSKWCAGCHDHAVFFNGRFDNPIKNQIDTPEAQNGLGCTSCHSIVHVRSSMGNGDFEIEYPPMHDLAVSENPLLKWGHDFLTYAKPELHGKTFIKPFMRENTAEFCASCHKVHLDKAVNNYRWFRGFNDYDNWQASGVSGQGARSFYYPAKPQKCADCHMPLVKSNDPAAKNGMVKSHRFPAANTALPFVNGDHEQLKAVTDFLKDKQISVDIFAMTTGEQGEVKELKSRGGDDSPRLASTFAVGEESMGFGAAQAFITKPTEVVAPLNKVENATVRRGESRRVEVVVRTRKVGHFFPGGTVDGFDVWVELKAVDDKGRTIFWSGQAEDDGRGPVEPGAHFYRSLMLDENGNPINKRNAWAARTVAYVRLVPPGAADTIHYRLNVPPDCGDKITLTAKVNYRKFSWWVTQWSYAGIRDPNQKDYSVTANHDDGAWIFTGDTSGVSGKLKAIPNLPTVTMAEDVVTLRVIGKDQPLPEMKSVTTRDVRERWNDYGIGLLLQGDLKGAENVFLKVTQMDPGYADGYVNVARARIQEGEMKAAAEMLRKALELDPRLAKTNFFFALALKAEGRYDEALTHLKIATDQYPRDRVVQNTVGRVLFLQRRYQEAVDALNRVLAVDPEDLQAHYNLMLCYQGLGKLDEARREETLYRRFKADESAQAITGPYRKLHPEDNNERQQIHEHVTVPLNGPPKPAPRKGEYVANKPRKQLTSQAP